MSQLKLDDLSAVVETLCQYKNTNTAGAKDVAHHKDKDNEIDADDEKHRPHKRPEQVSLVGEPAISFGTKIIPTQISSDNDDDGRDLIDE